MEVDGVCKVAPVVALMAGDPEMLKAVDTAVRVVQNTEKASAFACGFARVLEQLVLGTESVKEAIEKVCGDLRAESRLMPSALDEEVAQQLLKVLATLDQSHAALGQALRPPAVAFPFAGLA